MNIERHIITEPVGELITCPHCNQKLTAVARVDGEVVLCVKCRRCKQFVIVDIQR